MFGEAAIAFVGAIFAAAFLAVLLESAIEYYVAEPVHKFIPEFDDYIRFLALLFGIAIAFIYQIDFVGSAITYIIPDYVLPQYAPIAGMAISGAMIARGSDFMHQLIKVLFGIVAEANKAKGNE